MAKFVKLSQCPRCAERGRDRGRNNLANYSDGGCHCFSCGYHRVGNFAAIMRQKVEPVNANEKALLPRDFTRQVPAEGWRWLLQYGLPYSYWQTYCGFTEKENRLVFTVGNPTQFSVGRALTVGDSKWKIYGDKTGYVEVIGGELSEKIVLVEDIISAHKVGHVAKAIPLFGTNVFDNVVKKLKDFNLPVVLWLDQDQYGLLPKKINRLQSLLTVPVTYRSLPKDPKEYTIAEIKEILT